MKKRMSLVLAFFILVVYTAFPQEIATLDNGQKILVFDDFTWIFLNIPIETEKDYDHIKDNEIPDFLRKGRTADKKTIIQAILMYNQGWRYIMPKPKSPQAGWGNTDGRTTWFFGYWYNSKTNLYSLSTPERKKNGIFLGDNQRLTLLWRNGGSPPDPDIFMWLLSDSGGPPVSDSRNKN